MNAAVEVLDLGTVRVDYLRVGSLVLRQELEDIVHLNVVT